jgi:predicted nicotinamide N-methyase
MAAAMSALAGRARPALSGLVTKEKGKKWLPVEVAGERFQLLNLDHPEVEGRILDEMRGGIDVYYDRRWSATEVFSRWLLANRSWIEARRVLIVGAGVGLETVVVGRLCRQLFVNDLAPVALDLCVEQLNKNGMAGAILCPGLLEEIHLPEVDLTVACFFVYSRETRSAIRDLADRTRSPILLVNENLSDFAKLLGELEGRWRDLFEADGARVILIEPLRR